MNPIPTAARACWLSWRSERYFLKLILLTTESPACTDWITDAHGLISHANAAFFAWTTVSKSVNPCIESPFVQGLDKLPQISPALFCKMESTSRDDIESDVLDWIRSDWDQISFQITWTTNAMLRWFDRPVELSMSFMLSWIMQNSFSSRCGWKT
jgi:hypothetical protein